MVKKVERTRNSGTWTESRYWQQVRSSLRRGFRYWKPIQEAKLAARREYSGDNRRRRWEYKCNCCGQYFPDKEVQVDHVFAVGSLRSAEDLVGFLERLTAEEGYQVLCKECHKNVKTKEDMKKIKKEHSARKLYPREESSWRNMKSRCNNPNATGYKHYGGKGIKVCSRWDDDFYSFLKDMGPRPIGKSIDRIDVNKDYTPENCKWADATEQARNTSSNNFIEYDGEILCLQEWSERLGIKSNTILTRIRRGWSIEEAFEVRMRGKKEYSGSLTQDQIKDMVKSIDSGMSQSEWGRQNGIDSSQVCRLYHRFK